MKKIFVVEDDVDICREVLEVLRNSGYEADSVKDFANTEEEIVAAKADLVLLDINLPGKNGQAILKQIRQDTQVPVIMLTSRATEIDEVLSMSYGADDYITKPYNPTILLLRIAAILKRTGESITTLKYKDAEINIGKGSIVKDGNEIMLTKNEMIIFTELLRGEGRIVSRDELMTALWDSDEFVNDNALTVNISRLRNKLTELGFENAIETRKKQGYILM